jgi:hypothetical protein
MPLIKFLFIFLVFENNYNIIKDAKYYNTKKEIDKVKKLLEEEKQRSKICQDR